MTAIHPISVSDAQLRTAAVSIKTLHVRNKQVTLAVFRQLQHTPALLSDAPNFDLRGIPWGHVNYHPDCKDITRTHIHVVWQFGNELRRDTVFATMPKALVHEHTSKLVTYMTGWYFAQCAVTHGGRARGRIAISDDLDVDLDVDLDAELKPKPDRTINGITGRPNDYSTFDRRGTVVTGPNSTEVRIWTKHVLRAHGLGHVFVPDDYRRAIYEVLSHSSIPPVTDDEVILMPEFWWNGATYHLSVIAECESKWVERYNDLLDVGQLFIAV